MLLAGVAALALLLWIVLPVRYIGGVAVEDVRVLGPGQPDGSRKPVGLATPRRIAVTFSTPHDLQAVRVDEGLGFITAELSGCDGVGRTREVVTQEGDDPFGSYLGEYGRVRALAPAVRDREGLNRYRAVFDDRLTRTVDHRSVNVSRSARGAACASPRRQRDVVRLRLVQHRSAPLARALTQKNRFPTANHAGYASPPGQLGAGSTRRARRKASARRRDASSHASA